jgi:hypothetical protein
MHYWGVLVTVVNQALQPPEDIPQPPQQPPEDAPIYKVISDAVDACVSILKQSRRPLTHELPAEDPYSFMVLLYVSCMHVLWAFAFDGWPRIMHINAMQIVQKVFGSSTSSPSKDGGACPTTYVKISKYSCRWHT